MKDDYSGANFNAQEQADGKVVTGQYQGSPRKSLVHLCHSSVKCVKIDCGQGLPSFDSFCLRRDRHFVLNSKPVQNQKSTLQRPNRKRFPDFPNTRKTLPAQSLQRATLIRPNRKRFPGFTNTRKTLSVSVQSLRKDTLFRPNRKRFPGFPGVWKRQRSPYPKSRG